jgi:hypothetical protein
MNNKNILVDLFEKPTKTYKTRENAVKSLEKILGIMFIEHRIRYVIGVTKEGRFFPIVIGTDYINLVHYGVCVAS